MIGTAPAGFIIALQGGSCDLKLHNRLVNVGWAILYCFQQIIMAETTVVLNNSVTDCTRNLDCLAPFSAAFYVLCDYLPIGIIKYNRLCCFNREILWITYVFIEIMLLPDISHMQDVGEILGSFCKVYAPQLQPEPEPLNPFLRLGLLNDN